MENHDLLTAACATADWLREEIRLEDLEVTVHQTRLEALREFLSRLEGKPRGRRMRQAPKLVEAPDAPATAEPDLVA